MTPIQIRLKSDVCILNAWTRDLRGFRLNLWLNLLWMGSGQWNPYPKRMSNSLNALFVFNNQNWPLSQRNFYPNLYRLEISVCALEKFSEMCMFSVHRAPSRPWFGLIKCTARRISKSRSKAEIFLMKCHKIKSVWVCAVHRIHGIDWAPWFDNAKGMSVRAEHPENVIYGKWMDFKIPTWFTFGPILRKLRSDSSLCLSI